LYLPSSCNLAEESIARIAELIREPTL